VFVPGAVITFVDINHPGHLITHRIVKVNPDGTLVTKGDHNHDNDPQSLAVANVKGRAVLRVPYVGRPVVWIIDRDWIPLGLTTVLLVGVVHTALHPAGARRRPRPWPLFAERRT
jgi:signal peptidase I